MISNHGALLPTKMWNPGRTPGSSSSVASATPYSDTATGRNAADLDRSSNLLMIGEPQTPQKPRHVPGDDFVEFDQIFALDPSEIGGTDPGGAAKRGALLFAAHGAVAIPRRPQRAGYLEAHAAAEATSVKRRHMHLPVTV